MKHPIVAPHLLALVAAFAVTPGCSCAPSSECQMVRALCKVDVCIRTDTPGWTYCQSQPDACDPIEGACTTRAECIERFMGECAQRMAPSAPRYAEYSRCATVDCTPRTAPPTPPAPDAFVVGDSDTQFPDAARPLPDAAPGCAGVMCSGACCTAHPCFSGKTCRCLPSAADCATPDAGDYTPPPISPACCSDAPLCAAQNRVCCFLPASGSSSAETRCMTKCVSESRHCTFAPYLQADGTRSCLPPPYDQMGISCPF